MLLQYTGGSLLCQSLNSRLYLERLGCWKCRPQGNPSSFLLVELTVEKSSPYTNICLRFSQFVPTAQPQPGHSLLWCLPSTKPFHNGAYLEFWEQTQDRYAGFVIQGFRAQLHNLYSNSSSHWYKQICSHE